MSLCKLREMVKDRGDWCAAVHGVTKSQAWLSDWTTTNSCVLESCAKVTELIGCVCVFVCVSVCVCVRLCVWERERDYKELAHITVESGKSRIYRVSWQSEDQGKSCSLGPMEVCWQNSLSLEGVSLFLRAFNWLDETIPYYGYPISQSAFLKIYCLTPSRPQIPSQQHLE